MDAGRRGRLVRAFFHHLGDLAPASRLYHSTKPAAGTGPLPVGRRRREFVCDLEGTAGVIDHRRQCQWNDDWEGPYLRQARRLATMELNAAVEGALAGGATDVVAWDGHGTFPGGLDVELLHPSCRLVMGAGDGGPAALDASFSAMLQVGLHAMVSAQDGALAHSFWPGIAGVWLNGQEVGEIAMNCLNAGRHGVPCVFLAGDRAAGEEARRLVPGIETVAVKDGLSRTAAISLAPARAQELIREGARRAMGLIGQVKPYHLAPPYHQRVKYVRESSADRVAAQPGVRRLDAFTVEKTATSLEELVF